MLQKTFAFISMCLLVGANNVCVQNQPSPKGEIIYHVFQRSFYDSNGDLHGDFNGLRQKLDYLQELGITSILILPIYASKFYHNYFATDFNKIDPRFGTDEDWVALVKEVHKRGMKIYLDMETQYVTEDQLWWKDAMGNPQSKFSDFILWDDSANKKPSSIIFGITVLKGYDGTASKITTANLNSKQFEEYNFKLFKKYADPNNDGKFDDGVDGFRLDHMMDDLDYKGRLTNLFANFWSPLFTRLRQVNPKLNFVAEQANWGDWGFDYFDNGQVDRVFAFNLQRAISSFDKKALQAAADTTLGQLPTGKQQVVFIENHDMQRFASSVHKNLAKEKVGAALNLLLGGVPSIYYGQEIGMFGEGGFNKFGQTDANDIPRREAFEWYKADTGKGMAYWYKNTGPWWDNTNLIPNDGVSLEEERTDPNSLFNFYKGLIKIRQSNEALHNGNYQTLPNDNNKIFSFVRYTDNKAVLVTVNLSNDTQQALVDFANSKVKAGNKIEWLFGGGKGSVETTGVSVSLPAYGVGAWTVN